MLEKLETTPFCMLFQHHETGRIERNIPESEQRRHRRKEYIIWTWRKRFLSGSSPFDSLRIHKRLSDLLILELGVLRASLHKCQLRGKCKRETIYPVTSDALYGNDFLILF